MRSIKVLLALPHSHFLAARLALQLTTLRARTCCVSKKLFCK